MVLNKMTRFKIKKKNHLLYLQEKKRLIDDFFLNISNKNTLNFFSFFWQEYQFYISLFAYKPPRGRGGHHVC